MEFNEKLQELRKQKGLTQEELAQQLYVSRTAISKWESGRGYPNIDSLKTMAKFFGVTVDALLSGDELLSLAETDSREKQSHDRELVFGLLDLSTAMFFFLPFFGQKAEGTLQAVALPALNGIAPYLKMAYYAAVIAMVGWGILLLALQNCRKVFWLRSKSSVSFAVNAVTVLLFIISMQPYAAAFTFLFLVIKGFLLIKKR